MIKKFLSEGDEKLAMLIRGFKIFLRKKNLAKLKKSEKGDSKKTKDVIYYECKKSGHIRNECPKLKYKKRGVNEKRNSFKVT